LSNKIKIKAIDVVVLLYHLYKGAELKNVGFEDASNTLPHITGQLDYPCYLSKSLIESCLWSCNLMNELDYFWHPHNLTFDQYLKRVIPEGAKFHKMYNLILEENKKDV